MKKVTIKSTTTYQCYTSKTVRSNSYLNSPLIHNGTSYDILNNTTYEVDLTLVYIGWGDYARKYEEEYLNSHHTRSKKQTLKRHVQKLNVICFGQIHLNNNLLYSIHY